MVAAAYQGSLVRLEKTDDRELAVRVMTDPEMWERVSVDGEVREEFTAESIPEDWIILAVRTPHGTAGVYLLHEIEEGIWQAHANILEPFRERYSIDSGNELMKWLEDGLPASAKMIVATVPVIYPEVVGFLSHFGFQDTGAVEPVVKHGKEVECRMMVLQLGG